tara:strand:+ start:281 stop:961 length:681 start_codon:yes stop_codon:yes gene_type:complete
MNEFAIVSEGVTDYWVLKNILIGWFKPQQAEPFLKPYQPDPDAEGNSSWQQFGNWENVLRYLREKRHRDALEYADYLIVQIDTDQSEHPNFDVPQQEGGEPFDPSIMVERVAQHLSTVIGEEDIKFYGDRIILAICVREIECWLLPLWDQQRADKCEGCLDTLNRSLSKANEPTINPLNKSARVYDAVSKDYRKSKILLSKGPLSPSLKIFLKELERRQITLSATD